MVGVCPSPSRSPRLASCPHPAGAHPLSLGLCPGLMPPALPVAPQHMEFLGRRIARKLKLNYFDYLDVSTRHVIRHRPPLERDRDLQV